MHGSIFCHYVYDKRKMQSKPSVIDSNRTQRARGLFSIQHYAGVVEDDSKSFLDKNNDELPKEATDFLLPSSAAIFVELGKILSGKNDAGEIKDGRLAHLCMY